MRTLLVAVALAPVALLSACSSGALDDNLDSSSEALTVRGADPRPPIGPKRPPIVTPLPPTSGVSDPGPCSPRQRFDLRRKTRTCENLPGALTLNGATTVPAAGGKFRVGRLLAGTPAPDELQRKACIYIWEPDACAAPDRSKLLVEATENLLPRPDACITNPAACTIAVTAPATHGPRFIPNGGGRCEVCGYAQSRSMWVVLPPEWNGFRYQIAGSPTLNYVFLPKPAAGEVPAAVVEVDLGADIDVPMQDLDLVQAFE